MLNKEELYSNLISCKDQYIDNDIHYSIDLQLFAKPEDEGRTEEPTQYKIRKAREEGKVARSQEMISAVVLLGSFIALWLLGDYLMDKMKKIFQSSIINMDMPFTEGNLNYYVSNSIWSLVELSAPIFLVSIVLAFLVNVVQVGFQFTPKSMKFEWKKISFTANKMFSKIFFSKQTAMNLVKSILKVGVVLAVTYFILQWKQYTIISTINMDVAKSFATHSEIAFYIAVVSCIIFLVLSIPDYFFQKIEHLETLKMSRHEIKEERKDTEGDPHIKQRLKERQREILTRRMMDEIPKADVVITNPTHYAVAIKYDSDKMAVPMVVAKGRDYIALKIKEIAKENDIYIIENKPLAQSLFASVEVGEEIPEDFYQAIAEVLAFVIRAREAIKV